MKIPSLILLLPLFLLKVGLAIQEETFDTSSEDIDLPEELTGETFKTQLQTKKISLVEFYSPYCSHCKHFAPTWKSTYQNNQEYLTLKNIGFFQVNCVESGDLCYEEKIKSYPSVKLYSGEAIDLKKYEGSRNEQGLIKFLMKNENQDLTSYPDLTKMIKLNEFLIKTEAVSKNPEVYIFLPATHDFKSIDELMKKSNYDIDMINNIKLISDKYNTFVMNRKENPGIYEKFKPLEKSKLTFFFKVPGRNVLSMFKYPFNELDNQFFMNFLNWCEQMESISKFPDITNVQIFENIMMMDPLDYDPSLNYQNIYIFFYDPETTFDEDIQILDHLLITFSELQNVKFYKSSDDFQKFLENYKQIIQENFKDILDENFNEYQFLVDSITSLPTLVQINPQSPILNIYQNFGPNEIRDFYKVSDWLHKTNKPIIYDFYRQNQEVYGDSNSIVVLQIIDEFKELIPSFKIFKDYHYILKNYQYDLLQIERKIKKKDLEAFKKSSFYNLNEYVKKTIKEIYPLKQNFKEIKFAFIFTNETSILTDWGLNINSRTYQNNDVIIIDRSSKYYYDSTPALIPFSLINSPSDITKTLLSLNNANDFGVSPLLKSSPFGSSLRFMDNLHYFGFKIYFFIIIFIIIIIIGLIRNRRIINRGSHRYGILDDPTKFD